MIVATEARIIAHTPLVAEAAEQADRAKDRLARLSRGETVNGGLGKRIDFVALCEKAGWSKRDRKRAILVASLTPAEFDMMMDDINADDSLSTRTARAARKIIRARRQSE